MRAVILKQISWGAFLAIMLASVTADAQSRRRRGNPPAEEQQQPQQQPVTNPATGRPVTVPAAPAGTDPATMQQQAPPPSLRQDGVGTPVDTPRKSLRIDGVSEKSPIRDRVPIAYDHIREDDKFWEKQIWQVIDVREKMNLPFQYNVEDETGVNQLLINILLNAIRTKEVEAFSPIDDRFSTIMSYDEIMTKLTGEVRSVRSVDPVTGEEKLVETRDEFNPESIKQYKIKEVWVFDQEASALKVRILGIAPMVSRMNDDGSIRASIPLFWLYYPDLRPVLAKYDVFNPNNDASTMTWEDLFEMRFFTSFVVKEKNAFNRDINSYIKDGVMRLLEGQAIKDKIFNKEQDLWEY